MGARRRARRPQATFACLLVLAVTAVQPAVAAGPPASSDIPDHVTPPADPGQSKASGPPKTPGPPKTSGPPPTSGTPPTSPPPSPDPVPGTGGGKPTPADPPKASAPPTPSAGGETPPVGDGSTPGGTGPAGAPPPSGGGASPSPRGAGASAGASAGGSAPPARPEFTATALRPLRRGSGTASAPVNNSLAGQLGNAISALPTGILIGIIAMAVLALLMTGRSAWFARATDRLKLQRSELRDEVGVLQSALVPTIPPELAGAAVAVAYRPAGGPAAGGDFHDVFELEDGKLGIVVGDVSGHGPEALPSTAITHFTIRAYLEAGLEPRAALRLADRALSGSLDGHFATAVAAVYDPDTDELTYASAGHPAPLIIAGHEQNSIDALSASPIGLGPAAGSRQTTCTVGPGGSVWFFTDGLIEMRTGAGTMLGRDGLATMLAEAPEPSELLDRIAAAGTTGDDMTACNVAPGGAFGEPVVVEEVELGPEADPEKLGEFVTACGVRETEARRILDRVAAEAEARGRTSILRIERRGGKTHWRLRPERGAARESEARARRALGEAVRI